MRRARLLEKMQDFQHGEYSDDDQRQGALPHWFLDEEEGNEEDS